MHVIPFPGPDQRLSDSVRGCCRLLQSIKCHGVSGQRGERPPLYETSGADHPQEHPGYKEPARDPQRQGEHLRLDAGRAG